MFSELPKLLDRDFAVGFFLPAAAIGGGIWMVLSVFGFTERTPNIETLTSTATAIFILWLISVALLALHYPILRFLEGYPWRRLVNSREQVWKKRFRTQVSPNLMLQGAIYDAEDKHKQRPETPQDFALLLSRNIELYPDQEQYVLPTKFGNIFPPSPVKAG
jgi:hypothetical protein